MKKILIIYQTHGNEPIGKDATDLLIKENPSILNVCDFVQGNPNAVSKNVRYTDCDLNRVSPGDINSELYEERRSAELVELFKKYVYVIDVHETKSGDENMLIIPDDNFLKINACKYCPVEKVIIWPSSKPNIKPLVEFAENGFELEIGTKNTYKRKVDLVAGILFTTINNIMNDNISYQDKTYFKVVGQITKDDLKVDMELKNFTEYKTTFDDTFYPLCFGSFDGKLGYKMQIIKINY